MALGKGCLCRVPGIKHSAKSVLIFFKKNFLFAKCIHRSTRQRNYIKKIKSLPSAFLIWRSAKERVGHLDRAPAPRPHRQTEPSPRAAAPPPAKARAPAPLGRPRARPQPLPAPRSGVLPRAHQRGAGAVPGRQ